MSTNRTLMLVEDNEDDVFLMRRALKGAKVANRLYVAEDGQEAVDYLGGAGNTATGINIRFPLWYFSISNCLWSPDMMCSPGFAASRSSIRLS